MMHTAMNPAGPLMLDVAGLELTSEEQQLLQEPGVGGVILFARNFQSREQLQQLTASIRACRPELLIAVDQEGGRVQRFKEGFTRLPAMGQLGALFSQNQEKGLALANACGWLMATELLAVGVDISFAPVLDLDRQISQVIGDRGFSESPQVVIKLAKALMRGMREAGMATTAKHFPGHGGVAGDSHHEIPVDERSLAAIEAADMQPFMQLRPYIDAVMPAHVIYSQCDQSPAGFSAFWLQTVLRQQLQFSGLIFSDDLTMEAASVAGSYAERAQQALAAGCDMVLVCNSPTGAREVLDWLQKDNKLSCERVSTMKGQSLYAFAGLPGSPRWQASTQALAQWLPAQV